MQKLMKDWNMTETFAHLNLLAISKIIISIMYSKKSIDTTVIILLLALIGAIITAIVCHATPRQFIDSIPLDTLVFLIFIDIFIKILNGEHIFEYFALIINCWFSMSPLPAPARLK